MLIHIYPLPEHVKRERFTYKFRPNAHGNNRRTREKQAKPPSGIKFYKSNNFISASRAFVHFILHDPVSIILHDYLTTVLDPEEHFYSTLFNLTQLMPSYGCQNKQFVMERKSTQSVSSQHWRCRKLKNQVSVKILYFSSTSIFWSGTRHPCTVWRRDWWRLTWTSTGETACQTPLRKKHFIAVHS